MKKVFLGLAGLLLLSSAGLAGEARPLNNQQMDTIIAGYIIAIPVPGCDCYFYIRPQPGPSGATPMIQTPQTPVPPRTYSFGGFV
jgi:hypothetical protein